MVEQRLFGTSGIRGVFNVDLTPKLALNVGLALAAYASYLVKKRRGGVAVTTVEASMCFEKMIELHHGCEDEGLGC
jgi:phosphomannomutase